MSGPVSTEMGDRVRVQFPVPDTYIGCNQPATTKPTQPSIPPGFIR